MEKQTPPFDFQDAISLLKAMEGFGLTVSEAMWKGGQLRSRGRLVRSLETAGSGCVKNGRAHLQVVGDIQSAFIRKFGISG